MTKRAPTIVDLARELGLSKTTVSDALKGAGRVSPETRDRVLAAAKRIGYVPNRAAQQLRTATGGTVGLYVPADVRDMSFYMPFVFGAVDAAAQQGYDLSLLTRLPAHTSHWGGLRGAIVIDALGTDPILGSLIDSGVPVVSAGRIDGPAAKHIAGSMVIRHAELCVATLDSMRDGGVRAPALVAARVRDGFSWSRQVQDGYLRWCAERGQTPVIASLDPSPSNEALERAIAAATALPETDGILFGWEDVAERAELILGARGFTIGTDMRLGSLVSRFVAKAHSPYATVLDLRSRPFGESVAQLLLEVIDRGPGPAIERVHHAVVVPSDH